MNSLLSKVISALAMVAVASSSGLAESSSKNLILTGEVGGFFPGGAEHIDPAPQLGLKIGTSITDLITIESGLSFIPASSTTGQSSNFSQLQVEFLYQFLKKEQWRFYGAVGVGGTFGSGVVKSGANADFGLGTMYFLSDRLALRSDLRDIIEVANIGNNILLSAGISYFFDFNAPSEPVSLSRYRALLQFPRAVPRVVARPVEPAPPTPPPAVAALPAAPEPAPISAPAVKKEPAPQVPVVAAAPAAAAPAAAPAPAPVAAPAPAAPVALAVPAAPAAPPLVGVSGLFYDSPAFVSYAVPVTFNYKPEPAAAPTAPPNSVVRLPSTPPAVTPPSMISLLTAPPAAAAPAAVPATPPPEAPKAEPVAAPPVTAVAAEPASPQTAEAAAPAPAPAPALPAEAPVPASVEVYFASDSSVIPAKDREKLDAIAAWLKSAAGSKAVIEGHTDSSGSLAHNFNLSRLRAEHIRQLLVEKGVPAGNLSIVHFGPSRPAARNNTKVGRGKNRRAVTIAVKNPAGETPAPAKSLPEAAPTATPATGATPPTASQQPAMPAPASAPAGTQAGSAPANAAAEPQVSYTLLVGESVVKSALAEVGKKLSSAGLEPVLVPGPKKQEPRIRLFVGEFSTQEAARKELKRLHALKISGFFLATEGKFQVYAGSFSDEKGAERERLRLVGLGVKPTLKPALVGVQTFLLTIGTFPSRAAALARERELEKQGVTATVIEQAAPVKAR